MSGGLQLALGLDVPQPTWIPVGALRPGDVLQMRDHSGGRIGTARVAGVRVRWRARRAAWPIAGILLSYDRRVQVVTDRGAHAGLGRVIASSRVEVLDRGPAAAPAPTSRRRVSPWWSRPRPGAGR